MLFRSYRLPRVLSRLSALVVLTALVALPSRAQFEQPVARLLGHIGADETMAGDSRLLVGSSLIVDLDEWLPQMGKVSALMRNRSSTSRRNSSKAGARSENRLQASGTRRYTGK